MAPGPPTTDREARSGRALDTRGLIWPYVAMKRVKIAELKDHPSRRLHAASPHADTPPQMATTLAPGLIVRSRALGLVLVLAMGLPVVAASEASVQAGRATLSPLEGTTDPSGPRDLPTFVDLELDRFPRPAGEACAQPDRVVDVAPPASISDALAGASAGTTIRVAPGTYVENLGDPTALTWEADGICLLGADEEGEVVIDAAPGQKYGIDLRGDSAVLAGFTLRGFEAAVGLWSPAGDTQRSVTIERTRIEDFRGASREGIVAYGDNRLVPGRPPTVDGLLVLDVTIDGVDMGVSCNAGPCEHWWIERTSVDGRRGSESSGADAFAIEDGRQVVILDSVARNAAADGIDLKAEDAVVMGARVLDVGRNGIKLWHGGDVLVSVVDGSGADAALVGDGSGRYRYAHVLVTHHGAPGDTGYVGWWAYDEPAAVDVEIVDSVFVDNATGGLYVPEQGRVWLEHDDFADAGAKLLDRAGEVSYTEDLAALEAAGFGQGNLSADPDLCADRTPGQGSPLVDAGTVVPGLERDLWGQPRVVGAAPDIGPVERQPGEPGQDAACESDDPSARP